MSIGLDNNKERLYILAILALVLLSYSNALTNGFVFDDIYLVYRNPFIKDWHNIPRLFLMDYWQHAGYSNTGLYRPLTMMSFLLEYLLVGFKPFLYHMDNVLLHLLCSVLVFFNLRLILKEDRTPFITALLFAVHPVHTEAVSWISGRAELLWSFFALWSTLAFLKKKGTGGPAVLSSILFLFALLAKEGAIVLPVILAVYMLIFEKPAPGQGKATWLAGRLYPYGVIMMVYMTVRLAVLKSVGPSGGAQIMGLQTHYTVFLFMCKAFTHYIRLAFLPFSLTIDYVFPIPALLSLTALLPLVAISATAIFAGRIMRYSKAVFFGILVFFIALLPVSNIIPIGIIMSERSMYMPVLGPCIIIGYFVSRAWEDGTSSGLRSMSVVITSAMLLIFAVNSVKRNPFWSNQEKFIAERSAVLRHRIVVSPGYSYNYYLLANTSISAGDYGPETQTAAIEAASISPDNPYAHYQVAFIFAHESQPERALGEIMAALRLNPDDADTLNLAANIFQMLHKEGVADKLLNKAFITGPVTPELYLNKGYILIARGRLDNALALFDLASRQYPDEPELFKMQGLVLGSKRRYDEAIEKLRIADELDAAEAPAVDAEIHYLLGVAYFGKDDIDAAATELKKAIQLRPGYKEAENLLSKISE
jgi:protein O-mannosyl-transferase